MESGDDENVGHCFSWIGDVKRSRRDCDLEMFRLGVLDLPCSSRFGVVSCEVVNYGVTEWGIYVENW